MNLDDISIRTDLRPGDIGYVTHLHGKLYHLEYQYGIEFESYVAAGLAEFYTLYDPDRSRVWVCQYGEEIAGFLLLLDRGEAAQLRYFIISPPFRGIGLGKKLMTLYLDFLRSRGYKRSYLWTTKELPAAASLYTRAGFRLVEERPAASSFGKQVIEQRYELECQAFAPA